VILVILHDLSDYAENVVFVSEAPVYDTIECTDMDEAMDLVIEFGAIFQVTLITPDNGGTA